MRNLSGFIDRHLIQVCFGGGWGGIMLASLGTSLVLERRATQTEQWIGAIVGMAIAIITLWRTDDAIGTSPTDLQRESGRS
jgi:hypothetical protein